MALDLAEIHQQMLDGIGERYQKTTGFPAYDFTRKARNMPSFLAYIEEQKQLPKCLTMSLAAYIAFYSSDIQERTADGLICKRPAGNTYKIQDDAWALDFYYAHKDDADAQLVHAVLTNTQMWDQDLTRIEGLEAAVLADLELIRTQGAEAAYKSCL